MPEIDALQAKQNLLNDVLTCIENIINSHDDGEAFPYWVQFRYLTRLAESENGPFNDIDAENLTK